MSEIFNFSKALAFPKLMKHWLGLIKVNTESNTAIRLSKAEISLQLPTHAATEYTFIHTQLETQATDSDFLELVIYLWTEG